MKQSLQLKLSQHLTLTPQLQQSIRLLQLSTVELNQELERYLSENPLLERTELSGESGEAAPPVPQTGSEPAEGPSTAESTSNDEAQSFAGRFLRVGAAPRLRRPGRLHADRRERA